MVKLIYPAIFTEEDKTYLVEFPDLPGCQTFGDDLVDVVYYAEEALSCYLLAAFESGQIPRKPSDIKEINPGEGFTTLVTCDINQCQDNKSIKKTLTIPSWLNAAAINREINFSKTLQEALIKIIFNESDRKV